MSIKASRLNACIKDKPFPKLMVSKINGTVILFHQPRCGTTLSIISDTSRTFMGEYISDWNMEAFEDFQDSIILENN